MANIINGSNSNVSTAVTIGDGGNIGLTEDADVVSGGQLSLNVTDLENIKSLDATPKTVLVVAGGEIRTGTTGSYNVVPTDGIYKLNLPNFGDAIIYDGTSGTINGDATYDVVYSRTGGAPINQTIPDTFTLAASGEFSHWNTVADGSGTHYAPLDTYSVSQGTIPTLYARWLLPLVPAGEATMVGPDEVMTVPAT